MIRRVDMNKGNTAYDVPDAGQPVLDLNPGDEILLKETMTSDNKTKKVVTNKYTVVKKHKYFWLLVRNGLYSCFSPWEITKRQVV